MSLPETFKDQRCARLIDISALKHNLQCFQTLLGFTKIMAVVKANAYGHGASIVAPLLQDSGIDCFAVATIDEAIQLRQCGITSRIIILGYVHPSSIDTIIHYGLTITLMDIDHAKRIAMLSKRIDCVIAIDTGMHRIGIPWCDQTMIDTILHDPYLHIVHVYSHLCDSERLDAQAIAMTRLQQHRFDKVIAYIHAFDPSITTSLQASYGALNYPDMHYDYARIGVGLYGIQYIDTTANLDLKPVLSLYTHITHLQVVKPHESIGYCQLDRSDQQRLIATLSIGYVDGLTKACRGHSLYIDDHPVAIVGNICMDQCMIDVTGLDVTIDQPVEIIGNHQTILDLTKDIPLHFLEVLTNIDSRVPILAINV